MNRIYYFAALAAVAGVMTSCSSNEDLAGNGTSQEIQSANLGIDVKIENGVTSRAVTEKSEWANNDQIGVSLYTNESASSEAPTLYSKPGVTTNASAAYTNNCWTYASSGTSWSTSKQMPLFNTAARITAYSPYQSTSGFAATKITMKSSENTDWLYSSLADNASSYSVLSDVGATSGKVDVSLTLKHAQSKITVKVNKASGESAYTGNGSITAFTITSNTFATEAYLNSVTGKYTYPSTVGTQITNSTTTTTLTKVGDSTNGSDSWFVTPNKGSNTTSTVDFSFTIDGQKYTITGVKVYSDTEKKTANVFEAGKRYSFEFTLSDKTLTLSSVSITKWADAGADSGDLSPSSAKGM